MADKGKDDALREMAANRGCKLVRSRRRKPGGDFGLYGLADAKSGKKLLGFGKDGLEATADEIEDFLRGSTVSTWKSSLAAVGKGSGGAKGSGGGKESAPPARPPRSASRAEPQARTPKPRAAPEAKAPPPPAKPPAEPPRLRIRAADSVDGEAVVALIAELGYEADADEVADRIQRLGRLGEPPLLARRGDDIVGCLTWHVMAVVHRPRPVGRISMLVVADGARRQGIGAALVRAAEEKLAERGCGLVEVTSNEKLRAAHAFYKSLGYERTSFRFARTLKD
jgi:ribosomal protein S18 acetylase RimI-like enzyme